MESDSGLLFMPPLSITEKTVILFSESGPRHKVEKNLAMAAYGAMSAPAHASLTTIGLLHEPSLLRSGGLSQARIAPPDDRVGEMLFCTGLALAMALRKFGPRMGWSLDPDVKVDLSSVLQVMRRDH